MKNYKIEIKWALIFVLMSLFWMLMERLAGLHDTHIDKHSFYTNFIAIPAIAVYVFALMDKRRSFYNGSMTYGQGFKSGLIITLIVTLFSPITQIITSLVITPYYFENVIRHMVENNKMAKEEAEKFFSLSNYILQGLIGTPLMGLITTLVVTLFIQRKSPSS